MEYNELLNKIQGRMEKTTTPTFGAVQQQQNKDDTNTLLNKIGLEIRREGGN